MPNCVQFMHPGKEYVVKNPGLQRWNMGEHRRRLLRHYGWYVDSNDVLRQADLAFWNEFEAPTNATPILPANFRWNFATHYHEIAFPIKPLSMGNSLHRSKKCCPSTDPCVFGRTFKYSYCQQKRNGDLWNLPPNSIILFGSYKMLTTAKGKKPILPMFCLDTVFVVDEKSGIQYSVPVGANHPFAVSNEYRVVTLNNLRPVGSQNQYMFYRGKSPCISFPKEGDKIISDLYSFVPVRVFGGKNYNERCILNLVNLNARLAANGVALRKGGLAPNMKQGHKTVIYQGSQSDLKKTWDVIRDIVQNTNNFELGVRFDWFSMHGRNGSPFTSGAGIYDIV